MLLYVMRHGPAEDRAASGRDLDRPLSPSGIEVVGRAADRLRAARVTLLPRIVSSPALRAIETATIVRDRCADPRLEIEIDDALAPDEEAPFAIVRDLASSTSSSRSATKGVDAMMVGHQPWVERLVRTLAEDHSSLRSIRTATICALQSMGEAWKLVSIIDGG